jgi:SHS family sialic acid transporter-like MFS transporter
MASIPPNVPEKSRGHWLVLLAAFLGWMFDGLEMGIFPLVARPALQDLLKVTSDADIGKWMGYITALFLLGAACGGLAFGWLGDRVGRVRAMSLSILTYSIFSGLCAFAVAPWHLGVLRFVAALGMGGEWSLGVALVMEVWPEKRRPILAGVIGAAANVGFVLIAVLGVFIKITPTSWRWVMIAGAAPALLTFFIQICVPESQRWKDAVKNVSSSPVREIFSAALIKRTLLAIGFASIALIGTWGSVQWLPLWADKMAQVEKVKAVSELSAKGLSTEQLQVEQQAVEKKFSKAKAYTQILSGIGAIFGCFLGPWLGGRVGRRPTYFGLCLLSLLLCGYLFRAVDNYGVEFLVFTSLVGAATAAFYGWFPLYLPELFPTRARATGQGVSYNSGRILAAVGALTQGMLVKSYGGSYAQAGAVVTLIYALGLVLIWFAPETKGKPLPE